MIQTHSSAGIAQNPVLGAKKYGCWATLRLILKMSNYE